MSFGHVLDQWENRKRGSSIREDERAADPVRASQEAWLAKNGTVSAADREAMAEQRAHGGRCKRELDAMPYDGRLDLHGMTGEQAEDALSGFFQRARSRGWRKVLVIHGKGIHSTSQPVLARVLAAFLTRCRHAGRSGKAAASDGGSGATWVLVKD